MVGPRWPVTVQGELDRVSQTLTTRIRQLAERYDTPLPKLTATVAELEELVAGHLRKNGGLRRKLRMEN